MIEAGGAFALDDDEVRQLLDFLQFTDEDAGRIRAYGEHMLPVLNDTVNELYAHIQTVPSLGTILEGHGAGFKTKQSSYVKQLFAASVDSLYASLRAFIGVVHGRLNVEPRWYLASYCYLEGKLQDHLLTHPALKGDPDEALRVIRSLRKLICFDSLVACEAYFHSVLTVKDSQAKRLKESSAPAVLNLGHGVHVVPVVGGLDMSRCQVLHGALLHAFAVGALTLIVDLNRLPGLDSESGELLFSLLQDLSESESLSLVVAGVSPSLERELIKLRIDTRGLTLAPTLADAVQTAFAASSENRP